MNYNVLIVDDEANVRKHLSLMLKETPYRAIEAANGLEALERLRSQEAEALITDIRMPKMDGIELLRHTLLEFPELPSIVLSNYAEFGLAQQAIQNGASSYLLKATLTREELLRALETLMKKREKNAARYDPNERATIANALFHERCSNRISRGDRARSIFLIECY